ncbi:hypothetical protein M427DRAFT_144302 [Gonapodya prolifera JEL478]|uniref:RING-type domain-containing protein n=1 Tax=Gonapodya prolifera (strain JEL478) TaxID=1344416 RepID=A0A139ALR3_GONPJ|nr:hypothetical protein M427DRAFT_144302 [Gonapodya prolifera JEL478]|eukprot:KXS17628.1 hypothetical protein M427DRAFT_144302 [Gonapodya prolifera JEL478]
MPRASADSGLSLQYDDAKTSVNKFTLPTLPVYPSLAARPRIPDIWFLKRVQRGFQCTFTILWCNVAHRMGIGTRSWERNRGWMMPRGTIVRPVFLFLLLLCIAPAYSVPTSTNTTASTAFSASLSPTPIPGNDPEADSDNASDFWFSNPNLASTVWLAGVAVFFVLCIAGGVLMCAVGGVRRWVYARTHLAALRTQNRALYRHIIFTGETIDPPPAWDPSPTRRTLDPARLQMWAVTRVASGNVSAHLASKDPDAASPPPQPRSTSARLTSHASILSTLSTLSTLTSPPACPICLDPLRQPGVSVRILPCGHRFHTECVDSWLVRWAGVCPMCRRDFTDADANTDAGVAAGASTGGGGREAQAEGSVPHIAPLSIVARFVHRLRLRRGGGGTTNVTVRAGDSEGHPLAERSVETEAEAEAVEETVAQCAGAAEPARLESEPEAGAGTVGEVHADEQVAVAEHEHEQKIDAGWEVVGRHSDAETSALEHEQGERGDA